MEGGGPAPTPGIDAKLGANVNGDSPAVLARLFDMAVVVDGCGDNDVDIALGDGSLGNAGVAYDGDVSGTGDANARDRPAGSDDGDATPANDGAYVADCEDDASAPDIPAHDGVVENGAGGVVAKVGAYGDPADCGEPVDAGDGDPAACLEPVDAGAYGEPADCGEPVDATDRASGDPADCVEPAGADDRVDGAPPTSAEIAVKLGSNGAPAVGAFCGDDAGAIDDPIIISLAIRAIAVISCV